MTDLHLRASASTSRETSNDNKMGEETGRKAVTVGTQTNGSFCGWRDHQDEDLLLGLNEITWVGKSEVVGTQTNMSRLWDLQDEDLLGGLLNEISLAGKRVAVGTQTTISFCRLWDPQDEDLLPGLLNEITLEQIVPKLLWRDFHALSSVSRRWQQAIQSHQVHDARVRSQSTDTLIVIRSRKKYFLTLYSVRDECYHRLPGIPHLATGVPWVFQCMSLDGKIYVFGGLQSDKDVDRFREVHVLDLAGQRKWKQCANMEIPRIGFGCCAIGGKIYVFGGVYKQKPVRVSEVYDPKDNCWSRISPSPIPRFGYRVATLGEELFLYAGSFLLNDDRDMYESADWIWEVYHPVKDEWRIVRLSKNTRLGVQFTARGKFHIMTGACVHVYDHDKDSWSCLHSINFVPVLPRFIRLVDGIRVVNETTAIYGVLEVNDEILVTAQAQYHEGSEPTFLSRSKGFGGDKKKLLWEEVKCSIPIREFDAVCTIQL